MNQKTGKKPQKKSKTKLTYLVKVVPNGQELPTNAKILDTISDVLALGFLEKAPWVAGVRVTPAPTKKKKKTDKTKAKAKVKN